MKKFSLRLDQTQLDAVRGAISFTIYKAEDAIKSLRKEHERLPMNNLIAAEIKRAEEENLKLEQILEKIFAAEYPPVK